MYFSLSCHPCVTYYCQPSMPPSSPATCCYRYAQLRTSPVHSFRIFCIFWPTFPFPPQIASSFPSLTPKYLSSPLLPFPSSLVFPTFPLLFPCFCHPLPFFFISPLPSLVHFSSLPFSFPSTHSESLPLPPFSLLPTPLLLFSSFPFVCPCCLFHLVSVPLPTPLFLSVLLFQQPFPSPPHPPSCGDNFLCFLTVCVSLCVRFLVFIF